METLRDKDPMPFGKYKGQMLAGLPDDYLLWLYNDMSKRNVSPYAQPLYNYLVENIDAIKKNVEDQKDFWNDKD